MWAPNMKNKLHYANENDNDSYQPVLFINTFAADS